MAYTYINRKIYPNQLVQDDPLDDNYAKGYSYDDYINGNPAPWIELGEEQLAFKEANPKATVKEIIEAKLDDSRLLNEEKSAKYEEIRTYENNNKAISLSPNEKLDVKVLFPIWGQEGAEFGLSVDAGFCLRVVKDDTDILYEVIQQHTLSKEWEPGLDTASLYKVIDKEHAGTIGDPIPYFPPMEIFKDKYYIQNADVYKCTRDSGTPLSHNLKDLIGLYVEVVQG